MNKKIIGVTAIALSIFGMTTLSFANGPMGARNSMMNRLNRGAYGQSINTSTLDNNTNTLKVEEYSDIMESMRNRDYKSMEEFMNNMTDEEYQNMLDFMKEFHPRMSERIENGYYYGMHGMGMGRGYCNGFNSFRNR